MYRSRCTLIARFALALLVLAAARPVLAQGYTVTDLGILPDKTATVIYGIHALNKAGQTTGFCNLGTITNGLYADYFLENLPFLWTKKRGLQQLPMLPGATNASGWSLNDRGQIIGYAGNSDNDARAVLWEEGTVRVLDPLPGENHSFPYAINNRGQIVGISSVVVEGVFTLVHPVLWHKGMICVLPTGDYASGRATDINEKGQIVGVVHTGAPADFFFLSLPALWDKGHITVLGTLGGDFGSAWDINEKGQMVGSSQAMDGTIHGFLWERGMMTDPGTRGGSFTALWALNNKGQVVGESTDADEVDHAILIDNGVLYDLNNMIPADSGWTLVFADGINERGQITGTGFLNGEVRSFLLTPKR